MVAVDDVTHCRIATTFSLETYCCSASGHEVKVWTLSGKVSQVKLIFGGNCKRNDILKHSQGT